MKINKLCIAFVLTLGLSACVVNVNSPADTSGNTGAGANTGSNNNNATTGDGYDANNGLNESKTEVLDRRNQKKYPVVKLGEQYWLAQNLDFEVEGSRTLDAEFANFGRFYSWTEAMNGASSSDKSPSGVQGICPQGWHLPSDAEWMTLEKSVGMSAEQAAAQGAEAERGANFGQALKASTTWTEGAGDNSSGFNALATGYIDGADADRGFNTTFWTSTERINTNENIKEAWYRTLSSEHTAIERQFGLQDVRYPVRCVAN